MSCGCCCTRVLNFCKRDICGGEINFDILVQTAGEHTMRTEFLGSSVKIKKTFEAGEPLVFGITDLNENFFFTVELYDPQGNRVIIRKDGLDYDCFTFQTLLGAEYQAAAEISESI
jgi:hypothetical protein